MSKKPESDSSFVKWKLWKTKATDSSGNSTLLPEPSQKDASDGTNSNVNSGGADSTTATGTSTIKANVGGTHEELEHDEHNNGVADEGDISYGSIETAASNISADKQSVNSEAQRSWSFWNNSSKGLSGSQISNYTKDSGNAEVDAEMDKFKNFRTNKVYKETLMLWDCDRVPNCGTCSTSNTETNNLVIPEFAESLPSNTYLNYFKHLASSTMQNLGLSQADGKKTYLLRNHYPDTNFSKVLIVGVHGFFPTKYVRRFIGEPTGTSTKFMTEAENTFRIWLNQNKKLFGKQRTIELSKIALEKEGKIFDRVDYFYNVLKEYDLTQYDFIFIAAHSQGTPVSIILMSKLLENGLLGSNMQDIIKKKKIGILAMAGISHGPFYGINKKIFVRAYSTIENDSMLELFEFQDFKTIQSKKYLESLKRVLAHNVKIVFIGSIDDQLVPLYSSTCLYIDHPNIYRSIYIDKDSNTPNFLIRILNCSLLIRNMGLNDHGIIKEISNSLAGPLTGGGHSKIYNEYKVYDLGLKFFLYSSDKSNTNDSSVKYKFFNIENLGTNPYFLPWCLRGLMYESLCNIRNGDEQVRKMLEDFDEWDPKTKILKEMKYRLNVIKAKL